MFPHFSKLPHLFAALTMFGCSAQALAQVNLTSTSTAVVQNFDTLAATGTSAVLPTGWVLSETGTGAAANGIYTAGTGTGNAGDSYSFGATAIAERALGSVRSGTVAAAYGAQLQNNTGGLLTGVQIAYTGEQWRIANTAAARDDRLLFEYSLDATSLITGTWTPLAALDFVNPIKTAAAAGALDGNLPANRAAVSGNVTGLSVANLGSVWIRWTDVDASGADDGLAIDDVSITAAGSGTSIAASVNDVSVAEGNAGSSNMSFTVSLSAAATAAGTVNFATADVTASAPSDYTSTTATVSFAIGDTSKTVLVPIIGDTTVEPNETFNVTLSAATGGLVLGDASGVGSITNDDFVVTPINQIQGTGLVSPLANGTAITTEGIVTGIKTNGFFIQSAAAEADANPATSEGVLVFTGTGAVPATVVLGARVRVAANVLEFIPSTDLFQPPTTELVAPLTITQLSVGNPLPAAVAISALSATGSLDQLENLEHMRVSFASLEVVAGTRGFKDEVNATGSSNGVFWATLPGAVRPRREPGIDIRETLIAGMPAGVPRFDGNPETLRVDSDGLVSAPAINVISGQVLGAQTGVLDYGLRFYTFLPDPGQTPSISAPMAATQAAPAAAAEFTVVSYNMERFFDDVNDPATSDVALTAAAYANRLAKASRQIRQNFGAPDIIGVVEMENLTTLQALAAKILADGGPSYAANLIEGNDPGGIDVGFLTKSTPVAGSTPRVSVVSVTQLGLSATFLNPITNAQDLLNDRPPLVLEATVNSATGGSANVTVVANHLRSFLGVTDPVDGVRIRAKRLAQAEFVANLVQARQVANPNERIVVLGDFNAYEFNDGYVDTIGSILGAPTPATQVLLAGADLVNPNLVRLVDAGADYSYSFDGFTQNIDHIMVSQGLVTNSSARSVTHIKLNADFPETARSDYSATANTRLSDHDALLLRVTVPALGVAATSCVLSSTTAAPTVGTAVNYSVVLTPAAATGSVTVSASASESCTTAVVAGVATCSITYASAGARIINAAFTGGAGFQNSTCGPLNQTIAPATAGVALSSSVNPSFIGQTTLLTATVTGLAPTGSVTFVAGAATLGSATLSGAGNSRTASISVASLPTGTAALRANYAGDTNNAASQSAIVNQLVQPGATTTVLISTPAQPAFGQPITLTATVSVTAPAIGPASGTVSFFDNGAPVGSAPVINGVAQITLNNSGAGLRSFSARFEGNASFLSSSSLSVVSGATVSVPGLNLLGMLALIGLMLCVGLSRHRAA
jgi:uncharacterized protein